MSNRSDEPRPSETDLSVPSGRMLSSSSWPQTGAGDEQTRVKLDEDSGCEEPVPAFHQADRPENDSATGIHVLAREETEAVPARPTENVSPRPFTWRELTGSADPPQVSLRLGAKRLSADGLRGLRMGTVIRLDHTLDEPVEIFAGRHLLGYGRVVLVDGRLAVQVTVRRQPSRRQSA